MMREEHLLPGVCYNISKGWNYPSSDYGLREVKCLGVSKLVLMVLLVRYKHMDISHYLYVFHHFFPSKSRCLCVSFMHPWGLSYSYPIEPNLIVSVFSRKEHTCGRWHFPKMAKTIFLVPHALLKLCHSLLSLPLKLGTKRLWRK